MKTKLSDMTTEDRVRRASWTARYKDGQLEIVVPQDLVLEIVADFEKKITDLKRASHEM